ncbi:hypothetical protein QTG64_002096 [Vibrio vulnificus]|nr:hypothetical protein [Vibrio vulnificus]ELQ2464409.1 hypothetical protein [Vibrio vulnificus]
MSYYVDSIEKFEYLEKFCKYGVSELEIKNGILSAILKKDFIKVMYLFDSLPQSEKKNFEFSFNNKGYLCSEKEYILSPSVIAVLNEFLDSYEFDFYNNEIDDCGVCEKLKFALRKSINDRLIKELCDYLNSKLIDVYKEIRDLEVYSYKLVNDSILISEAVRMISSEAAIDNLYQEHYDVIDKLFKNDFANYQLSKYESVKINDVYKIYKKLKD